MKYAEKTSVSSSRSRADIEDRSPSRNHALARAARPAARVAELEKALGELVRLKALKDRRYAFGDANITAEEIAEVNAQLEEYYLNRDAAWDAARAAMRLSGNKEGTPE